MKTITTCLFLFVASVGSVLSQSASETAEAYFEVFETGEYAKAAEFFSPDALKEFREMLNFGDTLREKENNFYTSFFGDGASKDSVAKMSDIEFFGRFLSFTMRQAEAVGGIDFDKVEILGEVAEGEAIAHVVTRSHVSVGELEVEAMDVVSFEKVGEEWRAMLSGKIRGMAAQLQKAFE